MVRKKISVIIKVLVFAFVLLLRNNIIIAGQIKNDGKFHIITNPKNHNQKILNNRFEVIMSSQIGYDSYNNSITQDIGIVYDEKDGSEKFIYKNDLRNDYEDTNYLRTWPDLQYVDEVVDYNIYSLDADYDGGSYRCKNKVVLYGLNGKEKVNEFNDLVFEKMYNNKFYYSIDKFHPKFYIWDVKLNETKYIGQYSNCIFLDGEGIVEYEGLKINDDNINNYYKMKIINKHKNIEKELDGYKYDNKIVLNGKVYYVIKYDLDVFDVKYVSDSNYKMKKTFYNLLDENLNIVLREDIIDDEISDTTLENSNKYQQIIEKYRKNDGELSFFEKIGIDHKYLSYTINTKEMKLLFFKCDDGYYIYNENGKRVNKVFKKRIDVAAFDSSLLRTIFVTADEQKYRDYFSLDIDLVTKNIIYDKRTKIIFPGKKSYGYYAITNIDVTDSVLDYYDENTPKKMYTYKLYNLASDDEIVTFNITEQEFNIICIYEEDISNVYLFLDKKIYDTNCNLKIDNVEGYYVFENKLIVSNKLDNMSKIYDKDLNFIKDINVVFSYSNDYFNNMLNENYIILFEENRNCCILDKKSNDLKFKDLIVFDPIYKRINEKNGKTTIKGQGLIWIKDISGKISIINRDLVPIYVFNEAMYKVRDIYETEKDGKKYYDVMYDLSAELILDDDYNEVEKKDNNLNIRIEDKYMDEYIDTTKYGENGELKYWDLLMDDNYKYGSDENNNDIKSGFRIEKYKIRGKALYKIKNDEKVIASSLIDIINCNNNYFTYWKAYEYGLMDYDGNILVKFPIFDDTEEEARNRYDMSFRGD